MEGRSWAAARGAGLPLIPVLRQAQRWGRDSASSSMVAIQVGATIRGAALVRRLSRLDHTIKPDELCSAASIPRCCAARRLRFQAAWSDPKRTHLLEPARATVRKPGHTDRGPAFSAEFTSTGTISSDCTATASADRMEGDRPIPSCQSACHQTTLPSLMHNPRMRV